MMRVTKRELIVVVVVGKWETNREKAVKEVQNVLVIDYWSCPGACLD